MDGRSPGSCASWWSHVRALTRDGTASQVCAGEALTTEPPGQGLFGCFRLLPLHPPSTPAPPQKKISCRTYSRRMFPLQVPGGPLTLPTPCCSKKPAPLKHPELRHGREAGSCLGQSLFLPVVIPLLPPGDGFSPGRRHPVLLPALSPSRTPRAA